MCRRFFKIHLSEIGFFDSTYDALVDDPIERSLEEGLKEALGWEMEQLDLKPR